MTMNEIGVLHNFNFLKALLDVQITLKQNNPDKKQKM